MSMPTPVPPRGRELGNQPSPQLAQPQPMGMMGAEGPPQQGPDVQQLKQQFLMQVRQLVQMVDALSTTYPAFAPFAEQIMNAAQDGMIQVVSALGAQEGPMSPMAML